MRRIKFGTDGWRAVIAEDFTFENVKIIAQAISGYLKKEGIKRPRLIVGYDTRFLSDTYARLISSVLAANGIGVILTDGFTPTPAVSFTIKDMGLSGGVMVTASHNPAHFNGIKFKGDYAGPADVSITRDIERQLYRSRIIIGDFEKLVKKNKIVIRDVSGPYIRFLKSYVDMRILRKASLRILVDAMYGTSSDYFSRILKGTNCSVDILHNSINPSFGGTNPEPIARNLKELSREMASHRYDIGIANDGDADRVAAMRPDGEFINGQKMLCLLLLHMVEDRKLTGAVVRSIQTTRILDKIAGKYNLKIYERQVGFKHVSKLMRTRDILIGGEESGGIGFKNYIPERDGILSGLLLLEMMAVRKKSIADIIKGMEEEFGGSFYKREDVRLPLNERNRVFKKLSGNVPGDFFGRVIKVRKNLGGMKLIFEDESWIFFRPSGTESLLRICTEASTKENASQLVEDGKKFLSASNPAG